jgi:hypothetical protein
MDYSPESDFDGSFLNGLVDPAVCQIIYARYWKRIEGRQFLFTHGHHLDPVQVTVPRIENIIRHIRPGEFPSDRLVQVTHGLTCRL